MLQWNRRNTMICGGVQSHPTKDEVISRRYSDINSTEKTFPRSGESNIKLSETIPAVNELCWKVSPTNHEPGRNIHPQLAETLTLTSTIWVDKEEVESGSSLFLRGK